MNCMKDVGGESPCPHCGFKNETPQLTPFLPHRSIVGDRYIIGNVAEANGDGVTYRAFDIERKVVVDVREFLPDTLVTRVTDKTELSVNPGAEHFYSSCLNNFLDIWRKLARMRGLSALILVIDIVEENNTAYAVCEHLEDAITLRDYLLESKTGYLSWEEARIMFMPVLSTLSTLHSAGIIHRGISPNTLIVGADHKLRISGFSIPECRNLNTGIVAEIFAGYAPIEQFDIKAPSGPWTDIYAFAAVLYRALIGSTPIESTVRANNDRMMIPAKFAEQIPAYVINALINALQILPEDRTKTVEQFRAELSASPVATANAPTSIPQPVRKTAPTTSRTDSATAPPAKRQTIRKSSGDDPKKTAFKVGGVTAGILLLIFTILCFTVLKPYITFGNSSDNGSKTGNDETEMVVVANWVGSDSSILTPHKTNFTFNITEEYSDKKKGEIISQSISDGTEVPKGSTIDIVVSKGVEQITMIAVVGETYEAAEAKLTEAGFKCQKIDKANSGSEVSGTVASANLEVGNLYDKGTTVKLQVWTEPETTTAVP
ncbi:MAG: PASTA domain-containing protein [Ruminococcaceae bacterium]|nr:PASTA domain-containing protein [Oscillospiraceae bacterium]